MNHKKKKELGSLPPAEQSEAARARALRAGRSSLCSHGENILMLE
jgi:hypothetical protein